MRLIPLGSGRGEIVPLPDGSLAISFCFTSGEVSWCEWRIITENEPKYQAPPKPGCPADKRRFFNWLAGPLAQMAEDLNTTLALLLTLAAKEGGWTTADLNHNQP
jgi:hypothetical protein